jgi:uncharacterized 2Fe-2S/4Fe-4S cluster protein (DUF4445 family)
MILGDLVVDVPSTSQLHKQHIVKEASALALEIDPQVSLVTVSLESPDMHVPSSDLQKLQGLLLSEYQLRMRHCELSVIQQLQPILVKGNRQITVALYHQDNINKKEQVVDIIGIWPGIKLGLYRMAIDLRSTTIAAH